MIKGGGGALTREKIVGGRGREVRLHRRRVEAGGRARALSAAGGGDPDGALATSRASIVKLAGGQPELRAGFITDNGNVILDVHGLTIPDPGRAGGGTQPDRRAW